MKITAQALTLLAISAVANSASGGLRNPGSKNQVTDYDRRLANVPDFDSRSVHEPWLDHYLYSTFNGMSEEEIDAALLKRDTSYPPRQLMVGHDKSFKESACNSNLANVVCEPFDSFMADKDPATEEVKIPCGTCVSFDKHDGSTLAFPHGFNVVGKLYIPNDASFTVQTKFLLNQGLIRLDPPPVGSTLPRADGAKITFQLSGNEDVYFVPDEETDNIHACGVSEDMSPKACKIGIKPFATAGGRIDITAIDESCPSWTKLKSLSADRASIKLSNSNAASCYGVGAELMFTSEDVADEGLGFQLATVASTDPATGVITLTAPLQRKVTAIEDGYGDMYAVEVALMDRYVRFEPLDQVGMIGGHSIILHSPEIIQNIRGIEFNRFGQQGNLGRYPLHFHLSENVDGSYVSKNLVRDSNQRCYVIHGTHNVTLEENVAFDTFGHCFLLEDGGEWGNKFLYNLGATTKRPETIIRPQESDQVTPTTFWMTTMTNHFIGNVAAGSANVGFWFETMLREPSRSLPANEGIRSTRSLPLGTFRDNAAHSCRGNGMATYPSGYRPEGRAVMSGLKFYKNGGHGLFFAQSQNVTTNDSILSDNVGGMMMKGTSKYELNNVTIIGVSENQKAILSENRRTYRQWQTNQCQRQKNLKGVGFRFNSGLGLGSRFNGVHFEGFQGNYDCDHSDAIVAERTNVRHGLQDSVHTFNDITFDSDANRVSFCRALEPGIAENGGNVRNLAVNDLEGTINLSREPGFFLQFDDDVAEAFLGGNCYSEGGCAQFCPTACLRLAIFETSGSFFHADTYMKVTDKSNGNHVLKARNTIAKTSQQPTTDAFYGVWLPGGAQYDVTFVKADGSPTWPGYVYMNFDEKPHCDNSLEETDVSLDYPAPTGRCLNPIFNGDIETGLIDGWQERTNYMAFGKTVSPGADGSQYAVLTSKRAESGGSTLVNRLDISCLKAWVNEPIRLTGQIRLVNHDGEDVACSSVDTSCAPLVELKIGNEVLISTRVDTYADGSSWGIVDETVIVPLAIDDAAIAELVIDKAYYNEFLIDEWKIEYLGTKTFAPSITPTLKPTPQPEPTVSPSKPPTASPTFKPTHATLAPTSNGICTKNDTTGWTSGATVAGLSRFSSPNGEQWAWEECAEQCANHIDCEFWTLRLRGNGACLLKKNAGEYHDSGGHYEGVKDPDCSGETSQPTPSPTTSQVPTSPPEPSPKKGIGMHTAQSCNALENYDMATWYYDWGKGDGFERGFCDDPISVSTDLEFVPMFWDHWSVPSLPLSESFLTKYGARFGKAKYLLTFNEPELAEQANMTPLHAAELWPDVIAIANQYNLEVVAPCGTVDKGFSWYTQWIDECNALYSETGCAFDYTCTHAYYQPAPCEGVPGWACVSDVMNRINSWYNTFGKPVWVTEFACNPWEGDCDAKKQTALMQQIIPMFEESDAVFRYAWFEAFASNFGKANTNEMIFSFDIQVTCENKMWLAQEGSASWQVKTIGQCLAKADAHPDCHQPVTLSMDNDNCYCAIDSCDSFIASWPGMESWKEVGERGTNKLSSLGELYQKTVLSQPNPFL